MAGKEKDLTSGMNSMMGYATHIGQNKSINSKSEQTIAQITLPEPQQNTNKSKKGQKYLRLDITNYQDYISLMAEHEKVKTGKFVSQTQYILRLIEADKQKNIELYEKLEQIEKMKKELI